MSKAKNNGSIETVTSPTGRSGVRGKNQETGSTNTKTTEDAALAAADKSKAAKKLGDDRSLMNRSILRQSKYLIKGDGSTSPGKKGVGKSRIGFRDEPIIHEVENWKKYNIPEEEAPASSCSCQMF